MTEANRTLPNGTMTALGFIPHRRYLDFECPVKLKFDGKRSLRDYQEPVMRNGVCVYVMPDKSVL